MRLAELDPRWISCTGRTGIGISFVCPHCQVFGRGQRLHVFFENPLDGGAPKPELRLWKRAGETFEDITLSPSIDASMWDHWHGHITSGTVE